MNTSENLNKAADILESEGWTQGSWSDENGFCSIGAIDRAMLDEWDKVSDKENNYPLWNALYQTGLDTRKQFRKYIGSGIARWNDEPGRTKEEVVAAMRAAALLAEGASLVVSA